MVVSDHVEWSVMGLPAQQPSDPAKYSSTLQSHRREGGEHLRPEPGSSLEDKFLEELSLKDSKRSKLEEKKRFHPLPYLNPHQHCSLEIVIEPQRKFSFSEHSLTF